MELSSNCASFMLLFLVVVWGWGKVEGFGTFGFDIHHRYSDPVKGILDLNGLPEEGSVDYYAAMAHRDSVVRGRKLADSVDSKPLVFVGGNETHRLNSLGFLHYAFVSVGTPSLQFLVALDTGSDLFWLPCDCRRCVRSLQTRSGNQIDLNIYSPNTSSTSTPVPCNGTMCGRQRRCSATRNACAYQVVYLSNGTSTTGILVEDVLHLSTDDSQLKAFDAQITFGCGMVQTGSFLDGGAPNGLFGLGMENISVPSILAREGLTANSFSMCFGGPDGVGRIIFGDKGSRNQGETPFNLHQLHPTYNISITQITVGDTARDVNFTAIFDSGTSFTYLNDPAYSTISDAFNSQVQDTRHDLDSNIPFEYCYDLSTSESNPQMPNISLTTKGGSPFDVNDPIVTLSLQGGGYIYCLGVVRSGDVNIIGQNFMTGYRVVFDREKMVLGWKASDCYDGRKSNTLPVNLGNPTASPPNAMDPEATARNRGGGSDAVPPPPPPSLPVGNQSPPSNSFICTLLMILFSLSNHYLMMPSTS